MNLVFLHSIDIILHQFKESFMLYMAKGFTLISLIQNKAEALALSYIEEGTGINMKADDLYTPLHEAILTEQWNIAIALYHAGAFIDSAAMDKITPLHLAAKHDNAPTPSSIFGLMLSKASRSALEARDLDGKTPLKWALDAGNTIAVNMITERLRPHRLQPD